MSLLWKRITIRLCQPYFKINYLDMEHFQCRFALDLVDPRISSRHILELGNYTTVALIVCPVCKSLSMRSIGSTFPSCHQLIKQR